MLERKPRNRRQFTAETINAWIDEDEADFERLSLRWPLSRAAFLLLAACGLRQRGGVFSPAKDRPHFAERFGLGGCVAHPRSGGFHGSPAVYVVVAGHRRLAMRQNCGTPNAPRSVRALLPGAVSAAGARSAS